MSQECNNKNVTFWNPSLRLFGMQYLHPTKYLFKDGKYVPVDYDAPNLETKLSGYDDMVHDFYIPMFTIMQFVFFFGWLKVAETLINPFGDDDDDFDMNYLIDRNFQVSFLMVEMDKSKYRIEDDTMGGKIPPPTLPHTFKSFNEQDMAPPRLTENIIHQAEETANEDDGKPLFLFPSTTQILRTSICSVEEATFMTGENDRCLHI